MKGDRLLVATTNIGKLQEIEALLAGLPLVVTALSALPTLSTSTIWTAHDDLPAPEETGQTFAENARLKARYYAEATGLLTVAEDSGLEIDALDGGPGIFSARYPGATYAERFQNLYAEMAARGHTHSTARFVCELALASPSPPAPGPPAPGDSHAIDTATAPTPSTSPAIIFEARGIVEGEIAPSPRGTDGFGYDPIFYYPPYGRTLAEATADEKARVSHRGAAFRQLRAFLERHVID
jgi:XTP/dITP diphosphohydrolase